MDISPLEVLLTAGEWRAADEETRRLILAVGDTGGFRGLDPDEVLALDCEMLRDIDGAWQAASDGRFGFSRQAEVLARVHVDGYSRARAWRVFGTRVGWNREGWLEATEVTYSADAPVGHLPWMFGTMPTVSTGDAFQTLFAFYKRFNACLAGRLAVD